MLFVPPQSEILFKARKSLNIKVEGFADRAYNDDLSLVSRKIKGAVLEDNDHVINQVENMVLFNKVKTINGNHIKINVDTICLHGDTPQALQMVKYIVNFLKKEKLNIG